MTGLAAAEMAWDEARARSPLRRYGHWNPEWFEYWDYIGTQYPGGDGPVDPLYDDILSRLRRSGKLVPEDSVLDIGCGPGTFTLPIAGTAAFVTGIDPSQIMLSKAASSAASSDVRNLRTIKTTWERYRPEAPYDLVFSAFCPAIYDRHTLWKMEQASSRSCCYVAGDVGQFRLLSQIWADVSGESQTFDAWDISYPFELLQEAGRNPQLYLFRERSPHIIRAGDMVDELFAYFRSFAGPDRAGREQIRRYLTARSKGGYIELNRERKIWMLSWNVPSWSH
jgi:SAM-dependent methyltransferase